MRKGFLNGPVAKKEEETVNEEVKKETGAVPKVKAEAAKPIKVETGKKRRRRTRSMGTSLSPSPGRGFCAGFLKGGGEVDELDRADGRLKGADQHGYCTRN